ncbi:LysR family transcriptional regulator [Cryobacterium glaciale]|uniref:LysR family transcriptional regulator n=1 Tax=Cryobacterium glaciale TaxID=1259145 RepID=A0A4R8V2D9_9MICO|nr:LysR family transcriptional regulator [Cryobacterium glaciale]TFB75931.1 LysR family transcriptional regulator [Cryobacterium glaciale]
MFSLVQLECFIAVAEELHFGAAAERLRITQPPLSRQIQLLERELGALLFNRTSRRVEMTAAGASLLPSARRVLDLAAKMAVDVRRVASGAAGTLTVAYTAMAAQSALPLFIRRAAADMPDVSLVLRELVTTDQMDQLVKGTVDLGLLRPLVARPGIQTREIMSERMVAAIPAPSRLAQPTGPISLLDFEHERLLMYSPTEARYFHDLLLRLFAASGSQPVVIQYASQVPALLALVQAGLGLTLVPASAQRFAPEGVVFRDLDSNSPADRLNIVHLDVAWSEESTNPAVAKAVEMLTRPEASAVGALGDPQADAAEETPGTAPAP